MKRMLFIVLSAAVLTGCQSKLAEDDLIEGNANGFESNAPNILNITDPSVILLNDPYYEFGVTDGNMFELSMKVTVTPDYYINYAYFEITEATTSLIEEVGEDIIYLSDFDLDTTYTENYNIYRGGEFEIKAVVELVKTSDNTGLTIYSDPMSMKVLYPDSDDIKDAFSGKFDETWEDSKANPARNEYGYYIVLRNKELIKGELCTGDYNPCSDLINTVELEGDETNLLDNPTVDDPYPYQKQYIVGQFHTHPNLTTCDTMYTRIVGASKPDKDSIYIRDPHIPAFVYDYSQNIQGGHDINADAKIYSYGANGRDPWH